MDINSKKWWIKSKTIITAILIAFLSCLDIVFDSLHDIIADNLDYLKGALPANIVSIILIVLAVINIYTRLKATEKLVSKKNLKKDDSNCQCEHEVEIKDKDDANS